MSNEVDPRWKNKVSDRERRVYWECFWEIFGRTVAGLAVFLVIFGWYVGMESATVGSITIGSLVFLCGAAFHAWDTAGSAARSRLERSDRD